MPHGEYSPLDYYPRRLYAEEMANPYSAISSFFDSFALPQAAWFIDSWFKAIPKNSYWKKDEPGRLLHFYERFGCLVEAVSLIHQSGNQPKEAILILKEDGPKIDLMNPAYFAGSHVNNDNWDFFPKNLSRNEYINPYLAIDKFFNYQSLPEWRDTLYELLYNAFTNHPEVEDLDLLAIYKLVAKLIEGVHLIEVRRINGADK